MASAFIGTAAANVWYPSAVYQSSLDRIVAFVDDGTGNLFDTYWSGTQWIWESKGRPFSAGARCQSAVYNPRTDQIHAYIGGDDNQLYEMFWNGTQWKWQAWAHPSGPLGSSGVFCPSAVYQPTLGADQIATFVDATNNQFYELAMMPGSLGKQWLAIGAPAGGLISAPSAIYQPTQDKIAVFGGGYGDGHLHVWDTRRRIWDDLGLPQGGNYLVDPSAAYQSKLDRIAAFVTSLGNGHLYDVYWDGQQWRWDNDQGTPAGVSRVSSPSALYQTSLDRLHVFVTGNNGHLYVKYWNGQQWQWRDEGTPPGVTWVANPSAVYQASIDRIIAFVTGSDGQLYLNYWDGDRGSKTPVWEDRGTQQ
jgi:hypothetical protein